MVPQDEDFAAARNLIERPIISSVFARISISSVNIFSRARFLTLFTRGYRQLVW